MTSRQPDGKLARKAHQSEAHRRTGYAGLDDAAASAARTLAGHPEQEPG